MLISTKLSAQDNYSALGRALHQQPAFSRIAVLFVSEKRINLFPLIGVNVGAWI